MGGRIAVDKLKPHPKNGYYFSDVEGEKYEEIKRSIATYGIRDPLKVSADYVVISGHQRLRIAKELGMTSVPVEVIDPNEADDVKSGRVTPEQYIEYLLIAENVERRGQAETDPMKKARIAKFLKEYWGVQWGGDRKSNPQNGDLKTAQDVADAIGTQAKHLNRVLKLNDLIPELQALVSEGKLGTTAAEQLAYLSPEVQRALYEKLGEEIAKATVEEQRKIRKEIEEMTKEQQKEIEELQKRIKELERGDVTNEIQKELERYKDKITELEQEKARLAMELIETRKREEEKLKEIQQKAEEEKKKLEEEKKKYQEQMKRKEEEIKEYERHIEDLLDQIEKLSKNINEQGLTERALFLMENQLTFSEKCTELAEMIVLLAFDVPYDLPQISRDVYIESLKKVKDVTEEALKRFVPEKITVTKGDVIDV